MPLCKLACWTSLAVAASGGLWQRAAKAITATVLDPETELALALTQLDNLERKLETSSQMSARNGLGPQTMAAKRAFDHALHYYRAREWLSTIRELNHYLNLSQVPDSSSYLKAQYMLGRSYEEIDLAARGLRAYLRYVAAFLTAPKRDHDQLIEVVRRMIPLATRDPASATELGQMLASLTSLDFPKEIQADIYYITAKAAFVTGSAQRDAGRLINARRWLAAATELAKEPRLKARILYLQAMMALGLPDYDKADELLSEAIKTDPAEPASDGVSTRDLARLAMARIAMARRIETRKGEATAVPRRVRAQTALKYYEAIKEGSSSFKDALFESIYLHLGLEQNSEARSKAMLYLARWPGDADAYRLKNLLAYLDLRSGDLPSALQSIQASDHQLTQLRQWMTQNLNGREQISHEVLLEFLRSSRPAIATTSFVASAEKLFARLAEAKRRLADSRGELRDAVYTLGRANLEQVRPFWVNRGEQLAIIADEALAIGHRLAASERHLFDGRLDPIERQRLAASERRRTALTTLPASARRKARNWASLASFFDLNQAVAKDHEALHKSRAELTAARRLLVHTKDAKIRKSREARLTELELAANKIEGRIARTVSELRKERLDQLILQSPHRATHKFVSQYAAALHEESLVLGRLRENPNSASQKILADDSSRAWQRWRHLLDRIYADLDALDGEVRTGLDRMLQDIGQLEARIGALDGQIAGVNQALELELGRSMHFVFDQYAHAIDGRMASHRKWQADIAWLEYQAKANEAKKIDEHFRLETQILKDNLTDLEQGALWQWPD